VFLGDSITQGWGNNAAWKKHFAPLQAANFGIGGDQTGHGAANWTPSSRRSPS